MADHYVSINRGKEGFKLSDFTSGASATTADDIELRIADAANLTRKDVILALKAFERFYESKLNNTFPKL